MIVEDVRKNIGLYETIESLNDIYSFKRKSNQGMSLPFTGESIGKSRNINAIFSWLKIGNDLRIAT